MADREPFGDGFDERAAHYFEALAQETDDLLDAPHPAVIRARGDRRRTRRRTGIAAGTLGLAVLVAGSIAGLVDGPLKGQQQIDPAGTVTNSPTPSWSTAPRPTAPPSLSTATTGQPRTTDAPSLPATAPTAAIPTAAAPTATVTVTAPAVGSASPSGQATDAPATSPLPTWEDVPTAGEMARGKAGALTQDAQSTELPQEPFSICQVDIGDLAQKNMLVRHFTGEGVSAYSVVLGYDSPEQAVAARRILRGWYTGCADRLQAKGLAAKQGSATAIPLSGRAATVVDPVDGASFREVSWTDQGADTGNFEEATVLQVENRLEWVVYLVTGTQENHWDEAPNGVIGAVYPGIEHAPAWADKLLP